MMWFAIVYGIHIGIGLMLYSLGNNQDWIEKNIGMPKWMLLIIVAMFWLPALVLMIGYMSAKKVLRLGKSNL